MSDEFLCNVGVRQGENLSPLLFAFFVNDIEAKLIEQNCNYLDFSDDVVNMYLNLFVLMYADDTVILCDSEAGLKQALIAMYAYCRDWRLKVNCNKTKIVVFSGRKVNTGNYSFRFGEESLEVVHEYKYLGITFNFNGSFRKGQLELVEQAKRAMYSLIGKCRKFDLPVDMQIELYSCMVMPIMIYASEIWGYGTVRELELLQMKFFKHVLYVHKNTSTDIVYGELGAYPLEVIIKCRMINYWSRLILGKITKLSYLMYRCLLNLDTLGVYSSPWIVYIKSIFNECGMTGVWLSQNITNPLWLKKAVEVKLKDLWITTWYRNLSTKSICSSYKMYKQVYVREGYLMNLSKGNRILVARLRTGNNKFPIIEGRYRGISREERICNKCEAGVVGDEFHVLFQCQNAEIARLRNQYIPDYYKNRSNEFKYILYMQNKNVDVLNDLACFLKTVFNMFR